MIITVNAGELPADHWTKDPAVGGGRLIGDVCHFIDLARSFSGRPIVDMKVTAARDHNDECIEDLSLIPLRFDDGSITTIQYMANGPKGFPKERVELFWDGKAVRIDNFRKIQRWWVTGESRTTRRRQDKGHRAMVRAFLAPVRNGSALPIELDVIMEVARWVVVAAHAQA